MRTTSLVLGLLFIGGLAPGAAPAAVPEVLASVKFALPGQPARTLTVQKVAGGEGVHLEALGGSGEVVWTGPDMGESDKLFTIDGKPSRLALKDVDGDGVPEIITAGFYGPKASGLWMFAFKNRSQWFVPISNIFEKEKLERDHFVSDVHQDNGEDLAVLADGTVRTLGQTYLSNATAEPEVAIYVYTYRDGAYRFVRTEPLSPRRR